MNGENEITVVDTPAKSFGLTHQSQAANLQLSSLDQVLKLGKLFVESGYFEDTKTQAQAVVKILYGQEQGLGPMESMNGLYIFKGKVCMYADLIGDKIKQSNKIDYEVTELNDDRCILTWTDLVKNKVLGQSSFTYKQAEIAGLTIKITWKAYRQNMLFARALTFGMKLYARGVFKQTPLSVEEMEDSDHSAQTIKVTQRGEELPPASLDVEVESEPVKEEAKPEKKPRAQKEKTAKEPETESHTSSLEDASKAANADQEQQSSHVAVDTSEPESKPEPKPVTSKPPADLKASDF